MFDHQLGNAKLKELVMEYSGLFSRTYRFPSDVQRNIIHQIKKDVTESGARILLNDANGDWMLSSSSESTTLIRRMLVAGNNPIVKGLAQELKFLNSECQFGFYRKSTSMKSLCLGQIEHWTQLLVDIEIQEEEKKSISSFASNHRLFVPSIQKRTLHNETSKNQKITFQPGDIVEYDYENDGWFAGTIISTNKRRQTLSIRFYDGDYSKNLKMSKTRRFQPYTMGEKVMAHNVECEFMGVKAIGDAMVKADGMVHTVDINQIYRPYE